MLFYYETQINNILCTFLLGVFNSQDLNKLRVNIQYSKDLRDHLTKMSNKNNAFQEFVYICVAEEYVQFFFLVSAILFSLRKKDEEKCIKEAE